MPIKVEMNILEIVLNNYLVSMIAMKVINGIIILLYIYYIINNKILYN